MWGQHGKMNGPRNYMNYLHNYPLFACQDAVRSAQIELLRLLHFWPPRWWGWYHWDVTAAWYVVLVSELGERMKSQLWLCLIWAWYEQSGQLIRNPIGETCGPHWTVAEPSICTHPRSSGGSAVRASHKRSLYLTAGEWRRWGAPSTASF